MTAIPIREEVINVELARLLSVRGILSVPETIYKRKASKFRRLPDVIADFQGLRIVIEGRVAESENDRNMLFYDAKRRIEEGITSLCLAVVYPLSLKQIKCLDNLDSLLSQTSLLVRVISEGSDGEWSETSVDGITDILRRSYDVLIREDIVAKSVEELELAIDFASEIISSSPATPDRLSEILGIPIVEVSKKNEESPSKICRIASLSLVNAMIFHQIIANIDARLKPLGRIAEMDNAAEAFMESWSFIIEEIDYIPIFYLARDIIRDLAGTPEVEKALQNLSRAARKITDRRAALRHDLMGRIFHRLLADAKYFGAYYTSVPAATLLLKLTLDRSFAQIDWGDVDNISKLRIADLACGTGTLLKATLQTVIDNHVRAAVENGENPRLQALHKSFIENGLLGFDVVPIAIHLSASALAMHAPEVKFGTMHLYTLPLRTGDPHTGDPHRLGSLDFVYGGQISVQADIFGSFTGPIRTTGNGDISDSIMLPNLDLCVMNPPFTRSVGGNLLFGNLHEKNRAVLQKELKKMIKNKQLKANATAGLGSVFTAIGHKFVKPGGYLSVVLPKGLLSGVAWESTKILLCSNYYIKYIIVSYESGEWNFSENTNLSECLVIAKRLRKNQKSNDTKFINLIKKPKSSIEALSLANQIQLSMGTYLEDNLGPEELRIGNKKMGEVILCPSSTIKEVPWLEHVPFAQTELCRITYHLMRGYIYIPSFGIVGNIPLIKLQEFRELGPDRRDIHDGFELSDEPTEYLAFWGHKTGIVNKMNQMPNIYLRALSKPKKNRTLRSPHLLWSRAGSVLIAERLRLNTARLVSVRTCDPVLSNTWWPLFASGKSSIPDEDVERIITTWLNSIYGILSLISIRVETEGAWIELKKPKLKSLKVLNPFALTKIKQKKLIKAYESLSMKELLPITEIEHDNVRKQIDIAIMDTLGIQSDLSQVYRLISQEPVVNG